MYQYFEKNEKVLVNGVKQTIRDVFMVNKGFCYTLKGSTDIVQQKDIKKCYKAASFKFCEGWKRVFSK